MLLFYLYVILVNNKRRGWRKDQLCTQTVSCFVIPVIIPFMTTGQVFQDSLKLPRGYRQAEDLCLTVVENSECLKRSV